MLIEQKMTMNIDHFYTVSDEERALAAKGGYIDEGVTCYVLHPNVNYRPDILDAFGKAGQPLGMKQINQYPVPLYRLYHPDTRNHFYTTWSWEKEEAVVYSGYQYEGISCFIFSPLLPPDAKKNIELLLQMPEGSLVPLFRFYSHTCYDHFYTIKMDERRNLGRMDSYSEEGIQGYVIEWKEGGHCIDAFLLVTLFRLALYG